MKYALLLLAAACANSLRAPPPIESLAAAPSAAAEDLMKQADAAWENRKEQAARAEDLYLQAARAQPANAAAWSGAIRAKAFLLGREKDSSKRGALASTAVAAGQTCQTQAKAPACDYWLAAALGLQARERSATAHDALPHMVELLKRAQQSEPALDNGGPARLLAILLLRAPGWPLGPGDPEAALTEAQAAVKTAPAYAPNQLALGEALRKNGQDFRAAYAEALRLAEMANDPDAAGWAGDARKALH